jgi:hypothetical protein
MSPTSQGEVQFAGYTDSSKSGPRITLRLTDRDELQAFVGMEGKRFMVALVQIGDDEQPVGAAAEAKSDEVEPAGEAKRDKPIARWLALRCKEPEFRAWIGRSFGAGRVVTEDEAADWCRDTCGVKSRGDIDWNVEAERLFQSQIRGPWNKYQLARQA